MIVSTILLRTRLLLDAMSLFLLFALFTTELVTSAQDATPAATPAASPVALDPEVARAGRLGGQLAEIIDAYGQPDWTDEGLVGYNNISLGGVDTITMVFFDSQERVRSYLLVYLEQPEELEDVSRILDVVSEVAPRDGVCGTGPIASDLGDNVYGCASPALEGLLTPAEMLEFEVIGAEGAYSFSIDPTEDAFYEIVVRIGTDRPRDPENPEPTIVPTPKPPLEERYPPLGSIEELTSGVLHNGDAVSLSGTVLDISETTAGMRMLIEVIASDGSSGSVEVITLGDVIGIGPGSPLTVYGMYSGAGCEVGGSCLATIYVIEPLN